MKAWELLQEEAKWCQGGEAKDADGITCRSDDAEACQWCVIGAIDRCYPDVAVASNFEFRIREKLKISSIGEWNDAPERTHAEVLAVLKELDI